MTSRPNSRRLAFAAMVAVLGAVCTLGSTIPAYADHDDWRRHEWREHVWRERAWREHEWRERHRHWVPPLYAAPPVYGSYYAPPPVYYGYPGPFFGFTVR